MTEKNPTATTQPIARVTLAKIWNWLMGRWRRSAHPPNMLPHLTPHMRRDVGLTTEHLPPDWRRLL